MLANFPSLIPRPIAPHNQAAATMEKKKLLKNNARSPRYRVSFPTLMFNPSTLRPTVAKSHVAWEGFIYTSVMGLTS